METVSLLRVTNMQKLFPIPRGMIGALLRQPRKSVHAIDGVSFDLSEREVLALVGESGSGKTTTGLCTIGLLPLTAGEVLLNGENVTDMARSGKSRKRLRRNAQVIFQDPYGSLDPRQTVHEIVVEPVEVHHLAVNARQRTELVIEALEATGLKPASDFLTRFPQELSGGQRQRVAIASALVLQPKLLIADEPVSMLDVSIRAEILGLLLQLRNNRGIGILYITHDLATTAHLANRVAVMYLGIIVEIGPVTDVLGEPLHPYTIALMSAIPVPNPRSRHKRMIVTGETPSPIDVPGGCRFHPRCPMAVARCRQYTPPLKEVASGHFVACILHE